MDDRAAYLLRLLVPPWSRFDRCGPLAQLAEQLTLNQRVRGSSPWRLTNSKP